MKKSLTAKRPPVKTLPARVVPELSFRSLVSSIRQVHEESAAAVNRTVNTTLTLRNWVIGADIREYEQNGADRAKYGESVIEKIAQRLEAKGLNEFTSRYLRLCRQFATVYPGIWRSLTAESREAALPPAIVRSVTSQLVLEAERPGLRSATGKSPKPIWRSVTAKSVSESKGVIPETAPPESSGAASVAIWESLTPEFGAPVPILLSRLSFTHLEQLITIEDPLKRSFYEIEYIRGKWSVRDLKRQMATLYFERSGLSKDKEKLARMVRDGVEAAEPKLAIRDPYIFEFLGLRAKDAVAESDLEAALIAHMREFLLELGHGFCLEAQQKSIVIGKTRGFVDLLFYHRVLKCHVLVELKLDEFRHEHLGQLNTYVTWYQKHMMAPGDNPPVGLLLCTGRDSTFVEYAIASLNNRLFVSKYAVELPSKKELERFLNRHRRELEGLTSQPAKRKPARRK